MKWAILRKIWGNPIDYATLAGSTWVLGTATFALATCDLDTSIPVRFMAAIYIHVLILGCVVLYNQTMIKTKLGV